MTPDRPNPHDPSHWDGPAWILALSTLWIAQPLYDLLGRTPDYFLVRGLATSDIWWFGLLAFLLPPVLLVGLAELLGLMGGRARDGIYRTLATSLMALGAFLAVGLLDHSWRDVRLPVWLHAGLALVAAMAFHRLLRLDGSRHALRLLALLAPLAPTLFFLQADHRGELMASLRAPTLRASTLAETTQTGPTPSDEATPVVVLVLDELPLFTLMDSRGRIDADLFPNLAALSDVATWYRGATTPLVFTQHALPALVAGHTGGTKTPATVRGYPANLLTLLRDSHRVVSDEPITAFDPHRTVASRSLRWRAMASDSALVLAHAALPTAWGVSLPRPELRVTVGEPADPTERFDAFLRRLESEAQSATISGEPLLVFSHLLLPHHPWLRDESGRLYDPGDEILVAGIETPKTGVIHAKWQDDWETVLDAYERHVLQTRHADRLVGRLLDLLRAQGLFDRALIVVAADHGIHFAPGESLRQRTDVNADSLEQVPLLVKLPGQTKGAVDDSHRSTLDVLPTVLDVLGYGGSNVDLRGLGLDLQGQSLLRPSLRQARPLDEPSFDEIRDRWLERRLAAGPEGFGPGYRTLAGRTLRMGGVPTRNWVVTIDRVDRLENVAPDLPPPRRLTGRLLPRRPEALAELIESGGSLPLGVGIDDRMVATTLSAQAHEGDEQVEFSVLLPYEAVTPGEHQVVLYLLVFDGERALPPLPIPRPLESRAFESKLALEDIDPSVAGEARVVLLQGVDAPAEVFGWVHPGYEAVAVVHRDSQQDERGWIEADWVDETAPGSRYRFYGAPEDARLFRAVIPPFAETDGLRVIARNADGRVEEVPVAITDESLFRVTGPFGLRFDPRKPPPAYQNF